MGLWDFPQAFLMFLSPYFNKYPRQYHGSPIIFFIVDALRLLLSFLIQIYPVCNHNSRHPPQQTLFFDNQLRESRSCTPYPYNRSSAPLPGFRVLSLCHITDKLYQHQAHMFFPLPISRKINRNQMIMLSLISPLVKASLNPLSGISIDIPLRIPNITRTFVNAIPFLNIVFPVICR